MRRRSFVQLRGSSGPVQNDMLTPEVVPRTKNKVSALAAQAVRVVSGLKITQTLTDGRLCADSILVGVAGSYSWIPWSAQEDVNALSCDDPVSPGSPHDPVSLAMGLEPGDLDGVWGSVVSLRFV